MRRLAASLFGRKDDKKHRKEVDNAPKPPPSTAGPKLRPSYVSPASNSSGSSSTSFSVITPDEALPPSLPVSGAPRGWKTVFRSRKGSMSSTSLARSPSALTPGSETKPHQPSALARSRTFTDSSLALTDNEDDLSPPVRPFAGHRSSSSGRSSSYTNSTRSSRSSLVPAMPPIPASPPPLTPSVYMHAVIFRSLSRNPYTSPHPLLSLPSTNINANNPSGSDICLYPRSVNAMGALPPTLSLPRHLARLKLLERLKTHVFTPTEERVILRASSLFRLSTIPAPGANSSASSRQAPSLQVTAGQQTPQEIEATQIHRVDRSGVSRGLARWVRRGGFEERYVTWSIDESRGDYVCAPIQGNPVAALEFSEGVEAFAGLVELDVPSVSEGTSIIARDSSASSLSPYSLPSVNDLVAASASISLSARSSSSGIPSTPALSAAPSSPTPSSISLSPAMATTRPIPSSYNTPAPGSTLQRVPSLPKRRGVRFAPSVTTSSPPLSPLNSEHPQSPSQQSHRSSGEKTWSSADHSARRRSNQSAWGGPVVIVHPSTPADELEIDAPPPSPGSRALVSMFKASVPKQRASMSNVSGIGAPVDHVPFVQHETDREREQRERELREQERRRKSSLTAQQRLHDEVIAARKRRESYKLDGGSTSNRAQAALAADSSSFSYSSTNSSSNSSLGGLKPSARRQTTDPGSLGRKTRGQMWDISVDDTPLASVNPSSRTPRVSLHAGGAEHASSSSRPPSLRSIATMHGTGANANYSQGTSGQHKASSGNLRTTIASNASRTSLPAGSLVGPENADHGRSSSSRAPTMNISGATANVGGRASPSPGTMSGSTNVAGSGGLPRRRSFAPGDHSMSQTQLPSTASALSRESHAGSTRRASIASPLMPPIPMPQMYGVPYGMQIQMPMVMVQPIPVPFYVPVDSSGNPNPGAIAQNAGSPQRPPSSHSQSYSPSSYPRNSRPSNHSRSQSQHTLQPQQQQQHISPSSSSTLSPYIQQQQSASASASSHSLLSLSRSQSFSKSRLHQSITPPPPVPPRRHPPIVTNSSQY